MRRGKGKAVIVGQGYVGLPLAMATVCAGFDTVGFDVNEAKIAQLSAGASYIDDISAEEIQTALATGRYHPSSVPDDLDGFDVGVISVPTPLRDGVPMLDYVTSAAETLSKYIRLQSTVILESTTYPGTTEDVILPLLEAGSSMEAGRDFYLGYSPERTDPGNSRFGLANTPKVVSGIDAASLKKVAEFFGTMVNETIAVDSPREAELTKLLENAFRHVNIALVNEFAIVAHDLGINIWNCVDAAATKPFGFMKFTPGPGVGGHCLPIDTNYLSWHVRQSLGRSFRFTELATDVNDNMPNYVVQRLVDGLNKRKRSVNGSNILLLGVAYKPNTGDSRESPAKVIAEAIHRLGGKVSVADPHVAANDVSSDFTFVNLTVEAIQESDAILHLVNHRLFDLSLLEHAKPNCFVLDCQNAIGFDFVEKL